jgi:hypothetical protein
MNSKSLQYSNITSSKLENIATTQTSFITGVITKISNFVFRSETQKAQARYKAKHNAQAESRRDMVHGLPVEEKLRLGMYRFMN